MSRLYNGVILVDRPCPENVRRIEMGALPLIDSMHHWGIQLDIPHLQRLSTKLSYLMQRKEWELESHLPPDTPINITSPKWVADLLFHKLRVQGREKVYLTNSEKWEETGSEVLQRFQNNHPAVGIILDHREYHKLKSTYADTLPRLVDSNCRIHTRFKLGPVTGRYASENPNLQNQPKRSALGREIRKAFIAAPGWVLVELDLSQIEMRMVAHLSGEQSMISGYQDPDWDMHTQTAMDVFNLPRDKVDKLLHRLPCKNVGFGVVYRIAGAGLQSTIVESYATAGIYEMEGLPIPQFWTVHKCDGLIDRFYETKEAIRLWQGEQDRRAMRYGMVWTPFGRWRLIPQTKSTLEWVKSKGLREGANHPVQGGAQDLIKLAMAEVNDKLNDFNRAKDLVRPLLQNHDALLFECRGEQVAQDWIGVCKPIMEGAAPLDVPVLSSAEIGNSWGEME